MLQTLTQSEILFLLVLIILWQLPWKGIALWKAAKNNHLAWFIIFLIINLLAIPEIIYIFVISKSKQNKTNRVKK